MSTRALSLLVLFALQPGCDSERRQFEVSITNTNGFTVSRVTLTSDGESQSFEDLLPRATTPVRRVSAVAGGEVEVRCADGGCVEGKLTLLADAESSILIAAGDAPGLMPPYVNPPVVAATTPADDATDVGLNTPIRVTFSHAMRPETVTVSTSGEACSGSLQVSADDFETCVAMTAAPTTEDDVSFEVTPAAPLSPSTEYRIMVTTGVEDTIGAYPRVDFVSEGFTTGAELDETAPAAIIDLALGAVTASSVELTWTAVGDDAASGTAHTYDLRYQVGACPMSFEGATPVTSPPAPALGGTPESFVVTPLASETQYCFALRASDDVQNLSPLSNEVSTTTLLNTDATAPGTPTLTFSTVGSESLRVNWTAVGDDGQEGTAAQYELRYTQSPNCPATDAAGFTSGTVVTGLPTPAAAGVAQNVWVYNLNASTSYCFRLLVADEVPNLTFSATKSVSTTGASEFW